MVGERKEAKNNASSSSPASPPWTELPRDILEKILQKLDPVELLKNAQSVCKTWRDACKDPVIWRNIDTSDHTFDAYDCEIVCQQAVDRSQGQLHTIRIYGFCTDWTLKYIANRSSQLRRLSLIGCRNITRESLVEAARSFPLLEELHLSLIPITGEFNHQVGLSCRELKSFTYCKNGLMKEWQYRSDRDALAIAATMPQLRHLCVVGNNMTNNGLEAILDGCIHLESLDLRKCFGVDLGGDVGDRCFQRLKCLKQPDDFVEDYETLAHKYVSRGEWDDYIEYYFRQHDIDDDWYYDRDEYFLSLIDEGEEEEDRDEEDWEQMDDKERNIVMNIIMD